VWGSRSRSAVPEPPGVRASAGFTLPRLRSLCVREAPGSDVFPPAPSRVCFSLIRADKPCGNYPHPVPRATTKCSLCTAPRTKRAADARQHTHTHRASWRSATRSPGASRTALATRGAPALWASGCTHTHTLVPKHTHTNAHVCIHIYKAPAGFSQSGRLTLVSRGTSQHTHTH